MHTQSHSFLAQRVAVAALATLQAIADKDLDPASARTLAAVLVKMIERGVTTATLPLETIASTLGVHRNTAGAALTRLADRKLIRRTAILERGAPTRTTLVGSIKSAADTLSRAFHAADSITPLPALPDAEPMHASALTQVLEHSPTQPLAISPAREHAPSHSGAPLMRAETVASRPACDSSKLNESPQSAVTTRPHTDSQESAELPRAPRPSPAVVASMMEKIPAEHRLNAMSLKDARNLFIDPAWSLTDDERAAYVALVPRQRPEDRVGNRARPEAVRAAANVIAVPKNVAMEAWNALPALEAIAGAKRAGELVDEIAYSILIHGLGRGDMAGGVRAAKALIRTGKWTAPRGMCQAWRGVVAKSLSEPVPAARASHSQACVAQEAVH